MTGLQAFVNIIFGVIAYFIMRWILGYLPDFPGWLSFLISAIAAILVFSANLAARVGVK